MAFGTTVDIVTGATMGIGRAIAESMLASAMEQKQNDNSSNPYSLFLVGRNKERGKQVAESLRKKVLSPYASVFFEPCDVSDYQQVLDLKGRIAKQVDHDFRVNCLVNCAAECPKKQVLVERKMGGGSVETLDKQFATNVLGYHFMMKAFQDKFQDSFVVNVASNWAGSLDMRDLSFKKRRYDNDSAYRQSKQCNRMLTAVWAGSNTKVNACHPGDPCTTLSKDLGYNLWASPPTRSMIESDGTIPFLCG